MRRIATLPLFSCLVLLSAIAVTGTSIQAFAHTEKYNIGYADGSVKATDDYNLNDNGHNDYVPFCPTDDAWTQAHGPHSSNYCVGFIDGYNAEWTNLAPNFMAWHNAMIQQSTSQDSNVNIKGSNNRVTVNQQVNNNVGSQGSDGSSSSGHSGFQPRCAILCSIIKVN